jgi:hypothetical protein
MTEQVAGNGLAWLRHNIALNRSHGRRLAGVEALACDWTHYLRLAGQARCAEVKDGKAEESPTQPDSDGTKMYLIFFFHSFYLSFHYYSLLFEFHESDFLESPMDVSLSLESWDLIVGSDLVYCEAGVKMLPRVMRALCHKGTTILYAHTKKRYEMVDIDFFFELRRYGSLCSLGCSFLFFFFSFLSGFFSFCSHHSPIALASRSRSCGSLACSIRPSRLRP